MAEPETGCKHSPYFDQLLYDGWWNHSTFNNTLHLEQYVCGYTKFLSYRTQIQYADAWLEIISSILGITSVVLTLVTLRSGNFKSVSYFYFRSIAILELFVTFHLAAFGFARLFPSYTEKSYAWFWFINCIWEGTVNTFLTAVDMITVYLSVERSIACLLPTKFKYINTKPVAYRVSIVSAAVALILDLPTSFELEVLVDPSTGAYSAVPSSFGKTQFYQAFLYALDIFSIVIGVAVILSSLFVIIGMEKSWKKKQVFSYSTVQYRTVCTLLLLQETAPSCRTVANIAQPKWRVHVFNRHAIKIATLLSANQSSPTYGFELCYICYLHFSILWNYCRLFSY